MVARRFRVSYKDDEFAVDYDTDDGLEVLPLFFILFIGMVSLMIYLFLFQVLKFQIYSLASVPPDDQKVFELEPCFDILLL